MARKRRSQRDYSMGFKLAVVEQVEKGEMTYKQAQAAYGIQGRSTVLVWLRKHGSLDWRSPGIYALGMTKTKETPAQKIKRLEKELEDEKTRSLVMGRMLEIYGREYGPPSKKKSSQERSGSSDTKEG
jgi:transposase-like protein